MIRLLFERGEFDAAATARVTVGLTALAPGLVAFSCTNIFARAFFALGDTKTPMKISVFCLVLNALLTLPLVWFVKEAGLGIANSATAFVNVSLLAFALRKKLARLEMGALRRHLLALLVCAAAAAAFAWGGRVWWEQKLGHGNFWLKLGEVFVPMLAASLVYFAAAFTFRIPFAHDCVALLQKRLRR